MASKKPFQQRLNALDEALVKLVKARTLLLRERYDEFEAAIHPKLKLSTRGKRASAFFESRPFGCQTERARELMGAVIGESLGPNADDDYDDDDEQQTPFANRPEELIPFSAVYDSERNAVMLIVGCDDSGVALMDGDLDVHRDDADETWSYVPANQEQVESIFNDLK